jgi:hypothetical protein
MSNSNDATMKKTNDDGEEVNVDLNVNFDPPIPGAGIDAAMERRPGVPMEADPPHPLGTATWTLERQAPPPGVKIMKRVGLPDLTPVFGTAVPPRLLSGLMRQAAYKIPEHHTSHWLVLLLADRVDVLEHRVVRALPIALPILAIAGVGALLFGTLRSTTSRRKRRRQRSALRRVFA